ncbi:MAG: alpha/beta hydrolase [Deltaproteobacteria bacterium]|nr:alpha/beta hydrolase [Deltaproteobacteria bacterium]
MSFLWNLIVFLFFVLAAAAAWVRYWNDRHKKSITSADEVHYVDVADDYRLAVHRFRPRNPVQGREPLFLCHGLSANRFYFDFNPVCSLARYAAEQGWDTWVVELRGAGYSRRPFWNNPLSSYRYDFMDYLLKDLPAAVKLVLDQTGAEKLHWVGHSMGGMLLYAYLDAYGDGQIRSGTAVSAPTSFVEMTPTIMKISNKTRWTPAIPWPTGIIYCLSLPLTWMGINFVNKILINSDNLSKADAVRFSIVCAENWSSGRLGKTFIDWVFTGNFEPDPARPGFKERLAEIQLPMLIMVGAADQLTPPPTVRFGFEKIGSSDKEYHLFAQEDGDLADYGHVDILLAETSPQEVYPKILQWAEEHTQ